MAEKRKVILFGAGDGGLRVYYMLGQQFEVIAFVDNDPSKQGDIFLSKPVIAPQEIAKYEYDLIIIANIHGKAVYKQLTEDLQINKENIIDYYHNQMLDERIAMLRQVADEIYDNDVRGNVAELGVFQGEFAKYINESFHDRSLYLFDTFSGFNEKDILIEQEGNHSNSRIGEFKNTNIDSVLGKMIHPDKCIVKQGYFPESTDGVEDTFAFVSLDVDLYAPILEGLKYFYPRMESGGYIFIHDYNSTRFHGVKKAVKEYCKEHGVKYVPISDLCGSVVIMK